MKQLPHRRVRCLDPGVWPDAGERQRVLIENPDRAELWAQARILQEAGYEVATCGGPWEPLGGPHHLTGRADGGRRTRCPLLELGHCPLAEGADLTISSTSLTDGAEIIAAHRSRRSAALIVEPSGPVDTEVDDVDGTVFMRLPVTGETLRGAVRRVLAAGPEPGATA